MKKLKFAVLLILVGMVLTACGGQGASASEPLDGTTWELVYYRKSRVLEEVAITASFRDGQINGSAGCNTYSGSYQVKGKQISFGQMMSTMMFCSEPEGVMEQEQMYLEWLMDAQSFELADDQLMIFRSDGEALTFVLQ
jgi:heat shock protein HslJ